jgi:hypothetical protein
MATVKETMNQLMKDGGEGGGDSCPPATQDITINLKNRAKAITDAAYGPENPDLPNTAFWKKKADEWEVSVEDAKTSRCGNCAAFNQDESMLDCIEKGIGGEGDAEEFIEKGDLGYCEIFDFKCAASRTCDAWVTETDEDDYVAGKNSAMEGEDMDDKSMPMLVIKIGHKK